MVATKQEITGVVTDFVRKLEAAGSLRVQKVVLYGSYAHGWPHRDSDFDLVVLSDGFRGTSHLKRIELVASVTYACDHRLEVLAYTPGEYRRAGPATFLGEVKRTGVVVYEAA